MDEVNIYTCDESVDYIIDRFLLDYSDKDFRIILGFIYSAIDKEKDLVAN